MMKLNLESFHVEMNCSLSEFLTIRTEAKGSRWLMEFLSLMEMYLFALVVNILLLWHLN